MLSLPAHRVLLNATPAPNLPALRVHKPLQHQLTTGMVFASDVQQISTGDGSLVLPAGKEAFFDSVNEVQLGPVEKAVLHQAMYNQSKKLTPEMRRCDDCNVIFNSQTQAEMHYKGKKHAKVMYLKRCRDGKLQKTPPKEKTITTFPSPCMQQNFSPEKDIFADKLAHPISTESLEAKELTESETFNSQGFSYSVNNSVAEQSDTATQLHPETDNLPQIGEVSTALTESKGKNFDESDSKASEGLDNEVPRENEYFHVNSERNTPIENERKNCEPATLPQREPVVLPDPLPRYISRIEKPSVLKESLRCTVCDIYVNSENQMRQHVSSLRHKNIEKGIPTPPKPVKEDKLRTRAEQFRCEVCRVTLNSDIQLLQHLSSQRHKNMLEGRPPKPRWTPYERTQHALLRSAAQLRLSLKTVPNTGSPIFITSHVSNAAAPNLSIGGHATLQPSLLIPSTPAHLKQMAYLAPNGGILQTQEIVYVGGPAPAYPGARQQNLTTNQISPSHFASAHTELTPILNAPRVGMDPRELGPITWPM